MKTSNLTNDAIDWFMNKLSIYERSKIREKYHLNRRTFKITDEILLHIYMEETKQ